MADKTPNKSAKKPAVKKPAAKKAKPRAAAAKKAGPRKVAAKPAPKPAPRKRAAPKILAGGNPQIAKADGDAPVQAYIAAIPGWKQEVARRLDLVITRALPDVRKAVKWNSPFYGVAGPDGQVVWLLSFHCFTSYVKVAFFHGASLRPIPPGKSTQKEVRYLDVHEDDDLDETQFATWVKQSSRLPGHRM